ncbi:hypothetical protein BOX15_Mlig005127g2, partial [Macrostomum lignano]
RRLFGLCCSAAAAADERVAAGLAAQAARHATGINRWGLTGGCWPRLAAPVMVGARAGRSLGAAAFGHHSAAVVLLLSPQAKVLAVVRTAAVVRPDSYLLRCGCGSCRQRFDAAVESTGTDRAAGAAASVCRWPLWIRGGSTAAQPFLGPSGRQGAAGLQARSSASLTISLGSSSQQPLHQPLQPSALAERAQERDLLKSLSRPLVPADLLAANPSPQALFKEFWDVPMHHAGRCDLPEGAAPKNRYPTMVPNADTRVTIRQDEYINANFLRGAFRTEKCFIATQGPLADTVTDFWQMIWEQRPSAIVMLTDLVERERPKCHLYFPLHCGDRMRHGQLETVLEELQDCPAGYQRRLLRLTHADYPSEDSALSLQHYWFRSWPDHLSPDSSAAMLSLAESCLSLPPPIIVHCSAGLGRTGTFCAICICVRQLRQTGSCDCLATVCQLRLDRGGMVDSHEQYEFVHRVLRLYAQTRMEDAG